MNTKKEKGNKTPAPLQDAELIGNFPIECFFLGLFSEVPAPQQPARQTDLEFWLPEVPK